MPERSREHYWMNKIGTGWKVDQSLIPLIGIEYLEWSEAPTQCMPPSEGRGRKKNAHQHDARFSAVDARI